MSAKAGRGPLRRVTGATELAKHLHTVQGGNPRWLLRLDCGHTKTVKACELPKTNRSHCEECKHVPLNLEERLKTNQTSPHAWGHE